MKRMLIFIAIIIGVFSIITLLINKEEADYYKKQISLEQLQKDLANKEEKLIYYYQTNCPHCAKVSPIIIPMTKDMKINMQVLNLEQHKQGWEKFKIKGTPTIIHYKNGKEIDRIVGEQPKQIFEKWFKNNK